ncbi:MAG TPA: hypothetical protein VEZ20_13865 [Allosphingosinicella sp.]|jgi:hypothetical protein|nr:hypothetical protein [Allosphingosinicella sp.]
MRKNFSIRAFVEIAPAGAGAIELRNGYVPRSIATDPAGRTATVKFRREHERPGPVGSPEEVTLIFSGNVRFAFSDLVHAKGPLGEQSVIIGYYDARCNWHEWLDEDAAAAQGFEGLQFGFSGGLVLRIGADAVELTTG